jgi:hypothetical protein
MSRVARRIAASGTAHMQLVKIQSTEARTARATARDATTLQLGRPARRILVVPWSYCGRTAVVLRVVVILNIEPTSTLSQPHLVTSPPKDRRFTRVASCIAHRSNLDHLTISGRYRRRWCGPKLFCFFRQLPCHRFAGPLAGCSGCSKTD